MGCYEQKLGGQEAKCMFGDREENNLVEAEFINQNLEADFGKAG